MFALILSCSYGKNTTLTEYSCWTTEHNVHAAFAIIFLIMLLTLVIPSTGIFYENNCSSANSFTKIYSSADIMWIIFRTFLTFSLLLFGTVFWNIKYL